MSEDEEKRGERVFAERIAADVPPPSRTLAALTRASQPRPPAPTVRDGPRSGPAGLRIEPMTAADRPYVVARTAALWGDETVVSRGALHRPAELEGVVARLDGEPVGHATMRFEDEDCELVTIEAQRSGIGVGRALVERVTRTARYAGARRLWLITTNDATDAQAFYRRLGFRQVAVHEDAVTASRRLKPAIPERGQDGVPIRDEIEFELRLG